MWVRSEMAGAGSASRFPGNTPCLSRIYCPSHLLATVNENAVAFQMGVGDNSNSGINISQ